MSTTKFLNKMPLIKTITTTCFLIAFTVSIIAQSASDHLLAVNDLTPKGIVEAEWSFFFDSENKIYYIDFETISLNLTKVKVVNKNGKAIMSDDVADLPVNTIYELDCSQLSEGAYTVELHAYTEIIKKEVTIE